jgi:5-methylcytosine-specific restriction protein A
MPYAPKRPCAQPGCPALVAAGARYCEPHQRAERVRVDERRESASARGYDRHWQKARAAYLAANPLCVRCLEQGRTTAAALVDHIIPHKGDPALFWDMENWMALCTPHHASKSAKEDGGFGNRRANA